VIRADGGNANASNAGGGGGGRVAVVATAAGGFAGTVTVNGGSGLTSGAAGSIVGP
jgi:hypothetical protein